MNDREAEAKWKEYDQSFSDPMDNEEVTDFKDLENDKAPKNEWGHYGEYELVGNGKVTSDTQNTKHICGQFLGYKGCLNVDLHAHVSLDGVNHSGNMYVKKIFHSCDKPTCPVCFKSGWAVREATAIEERILKMQNGCIDKAYKDKKGKFHPGIHHVPMGLAEHIIASVPVTDYGLTFTQLREKIVKVLRSRGILGGVYIFHAFRYRNYKDAFREGKPMGWFFSPHFHVIGFIDGGYGCCRSCKNILLDDGGNVQVQDFKTCLNCKCGFEGRQRREYLIEGGRLGVGGAVSAYIVKVQAKRKTLHGTAWYQLNHSSIVRGAKRAQVATWFGVCAKNKVHLEKGDRIRKDVCPICQHELIDLMYVGGDGDPHSEWWWKDREEAYLDKDGMPKWIPKSKVRSYGDWSSV